MENSCWLKWNQSLSQQKLREEAKPTAECQYPFWQHYIIQPKIFIAFFLGAFSMFFNSSELAALVFQPLMTIHAFHSSAPDNGTFVFYSILSLMMLNKRTTRISTWKPQFQVIIGKMLSPYNCIITIILCNVGSSLLAVSSCLCIAGLEHNQAFS